MRIDIGDRHSSACLQAGPAGCLGGQPAGALADGENGARHLLVDDMLQARVKGGEVFLRWESFALGPDGFVAGGAGVALLLAGELPDDPVGGFDQAVSSSVDLRRFVEDLERFGEEPLG